MIDSVRRKSRDLKLKAIYENLEETLETGMKGNWSALKIMDHLFDLELERRKQNRVALCYRQSGLSEKLTIDQFDFNHHSSRKKQKAGILNLLNLTFIEENKNVILIGNPGVGKSFLAKCIAYSATQNGIKTLFTTAADMINHLIASEVDRTLLKKLHQYASPPLLVIDEIGYLPLDEMGSNLFFQVISKRDEKKSTIITTNRVFADWGKIFNNTITASAIADRLVSNIEPIILEGQSYRKKR
jgi:DNA replication protein DnaC